ncbi:hypothetical protein JOC86_003480 [Bacillus pakistanensis]|uniref:Uncharacterized protein n=1 Tax=Rossellomorea pakistanensis TaxID=992288 RepID=A0ABS2NGH7_9BACI|nr:hypothetical protein [Bacillus pakistanensis]MBM7586928.1 hypothetical protein [Bacillus pakistanensis]
MNNIYLVGAQQKSEVLKDWEQFKRSIVLDMNLSNQKVIKVIDYVSPPEVCPDMNASISFTAATLSNQKLYVGTQTEVIVFNTQNFKSEKYISLPLFNDIHHVKPRKNGNLLVVNTGLEMVIELSANGKIINYWNVLGEDPWGRFSKTTDYRKVPTTKPHQSHPNYVFELNDEIWVTRCLQKDAICVTEPNKKITIGRQLIHDGIVFNNKIYFTQVDGCIVIVNANTLEIEKVINLLNISGKDKKLGWCRGIKPLNEDIVLVGFSRIRPSRKINKDGTTEWLGGYGVMPTRLACYDIKKNKLLWEKNLEDYDLNVIYSIN